MNTLLDTTFSDRRAPQLPAKAAVDFPNDMLYMLIDELAHGLVVLGADTRILL